jgi:hypothetical protein
MSASIFAAATSTPADPSCSSTAHTPTCVAVVSLSSHRLEWPELRDSRCQQSGTRANGLIHEMLHTLGLRENPPTSTEIARRVRARCGA